MSLPQPLPAVQPAPKDSPRLCSSWGLGEGVCPSPLTRKRPRGRGRAGARTLTEGNPALSFRTFGKLASYLCCAGSPSIFPFLTGSSSPHSVCVSSDKAVLPGDPDYIQYLIDYTHRPAWSLLSWAFVLPFSFALSSSVPFI